MQRGEHSGHLNYLVVLKLKYRKHLEANIVIDCIICLVLSLTGYHNNFMRHKQVLRSYTHETGKHNQFSAVFELYKIIQLSGLGA